MKKIGRLKKFWNRLEALSNTGKVILVFSLLLGTQMCSMAGWKGYYQTYPATTVNEYVTKSAINSVLINLKNNKLWLELPQGCSEYFLMGILTPFTPPIPIIWLRSWTFGNSPCNNFTIQSKPSATIKLKLKNPKTNQPEIYEPKTSEALYGYTRHTFSLKSKNLDSGILIIEKDGEKIEVPFEYKYAKFWH